MAEIETTGNSHNDENESIPTPSLKSTLQSYKKDSKNFFLGIFLGQCMKKRLPSDKWYFWKKEMVESVDRNEEAMKNALINHGHEFIHEFMRENDETWNQTLDEKVTNLIDELKTVEEAIKNEGLNTIWGKIKYNGVVLNSILGESKKIMDNEDRKYDVLDYVEYKKGLWDRHYKRLREKNERRDLYYR